jgi:hypothetical protein
MLTSKSVECQGTPGKKGLIQYIDFNCATPAGDGDQYDFVMAVKFEPWGDGYRFSLYNPYHRFVDPSLNYSISNLFLLQNNTIYVPPGWFNVHENHVNVTVVNDPTLWSQGKLSFTTCHISQSSFTSPEYCNTPGFDFVHQYLLTFRDGSVTEAFMNVDTNQQYTSTNLPTIKKLSGNFNISNFNDLSINRSKKRYK